MPFDLAAPVDTLGVHPHAQAAAEATADQGRYWEMHDLLFRNLPQLEPGDLHRYAERLRLDLARFQSDRGLRDLASLGVALR